MSQAVAAELFSRGSPLGDGVAEGVVGEARVYTLHGLPVVIKRFKNTNLAEAWKEAIAEYTAHWNIWGSMSEECHNYFARPWKMQSVQVASHPPHPYTAQAYVGAGGYTVLGWTVFWQRFSKAKADVAELEKKIAGELARILCCLYNAGYRHNDLHAGNVLLLFAEARVASTVRVKIIDFGDAVRFSDNDQWWWSETMIRDLHTLNHEGRKHGLWRSVIRKANEEFKRTCASASS